jgi:gamma-glutamyltranspeptidase/glutathione hydrolase
VADDALIPPLPSHRAQPGSTLRSERSCVLARRGMVCASVPSAAAAGVEMLRRGGNAIDAALATAAVLGVVEPMSTGIGGDAFALLWSARDGRLVGLNGSGRAPAAASLAAYRKRGLETIAPRGILSATVPGAVHAWETLSERYGVLPLGDVLEPAIRLARDGFPVTELVAHYWWALERGDALHNEAARRTWTRDGRTPRAGEWFRVPALAASLEAIAKGGARAFYAGEIANAIVATSREEGGCFAHDDLEAHASTWVDPISTSYRGVEVAELPPNGQGLAALIALNVLERFDSQEVAAESALAWHRRIEAIKLAFADRDAYFADPEHAEVPVEALLARSYAKRRAALIGERALAGPAPGLGGDTVYLCAADGEGNLVSFIQSLFTGFGSGVGCGETGVLLQSRGAGFRLEAGHPDALAPGKRPFHTIIPGMLLRREPAGATRPWMAFGVMGGDVQPQGHLAFVSNVVDAGLNPQEALDRARFRYVGGREVVIETPDARVDEGGRLEDALRARGHEVRGPGSWMADVFGGGQAIARQPDGTLVGASDRRKDGCASGLH